MTTQKFAPQDPDYDARCRDSFYRQPAMHLIGAELSRLEPGLCEVSLERTEKVTQQHGFVHGGIVGMIADSAAGYAAFSLFPANSTILTVEYKLNLMAPADADRLLARATVVRTGRTLTICDLDVFGIKEGAEVHCAHGLATMICILGRADVQRASLPNSAR